MWLRAVVLVRCITAFNSGARRSLRLHFNTVEWLWWWFWCLLFVHLLFCPDFVGDLLWLSAQRKKYGKYLTNSYTFDTFSARAHRQINMRRVMVGSGDSDSSHSKQKYYYFFRRFSVFIFIPTRTFVAVVRLGCKRKAYYATTNDRCGIETCAQSKRNKWYDETKRKAAKKKDDEERNEHTNRQWVADMYRLVLLFVRTEQIRATHQSLFLDTTMAAEAVATRNENQFNQLPVGFCHRCVCVVNYMKQNLLSN